MKTHFRNKKFLFIFIPTLGVVILSLILLVFFLNNQNSNTDSRNKAAAPVCDYSNPPMGCSYTGPIDDNTRCVSLMCGGKNCPVPTQVICRAVGTGTPYITTGPDGCPGYVCPMGGTTTTTTSGRCPVPTLPNCRTVGTGTPYLTTGPDGCQQYVCPAVGNTTTTTSVRCPVPTQPICRAVGTGTPYITTGPDGCQQYVCPIADTATTTSTVTTSTITINNGDTLLTINASCVGGTNNTASPVPAPIIVNGMNQVTTYSTFVAPNTTGTVTCGTYFDPISQSNKTPLQASLNYGPGNYTLSCQYTGCSSTTNTTTVTTSITNTITTTTNVTNTIGQTTSTGDTSSTSGLTMNKTVQDLNGGTINRGDTLEYTMTINNTSAATINNIQLTDNIPTYTSYVSSSLSIVSGPNAGSKTDTIGDDQGEFSSNRITVRLGTGAGSTAAGSLSAGQSTVVRFRVTIDSNAPSSAQINNQASISAQNIAGSFTVLSDGNSTTSGLQSTSTVIGGTGQTALPNTGILDDIGLYTAIAITLIGSALFMFNKEWILNKFKKKTRNQPTKQ